MKKILSVLLTLVVSAGIAFAESKINPNTIKTDTQYKDYVEEVFFDKTPTAFSYVKRQIIYKVDIDSTGKISNYEMLQSSGSDKYDTKVKEAITTIVLPAFPKNTKMKSLTFTYDVEKRMNVKIPVKMPAGLKL